MSTNRRGFYPWPRTLAGRDALALVALAGAGFLGNWFALPLVGGVHFLLGGVAVIVTALRRSLAETLFVVLVSSSATILLWGHAHAVAVLTAEALVVAALYQRDGRNPVTYDLGFWLLLGAPLTFVGTQLTLGLDTLSSGVIALKQLVNGVGYTATAAILHGLVRQPQQAVGAAESKPRLADVWIPVLVLFAVVPSLVGVTWYTYAERRHINGDVAQRLNAAAVELPSVLSPMAVTPGRLARWLRRLPATPSQRYALATRSANGEVQAEIPLDWLSRRPVQHRLPGGITKQLSNGGGPTMRAMRGAFFAQPVSVSAPEMGNGQLIVGIEGQSFIDRLRRAQLASMALIALVTIVVVPAAGILASRQVHWTNLLLQRLYQVRRRVLDGERGRWPTSRLAELQQLSEGMEALEDDLAAHMAAFEEGEARLRGIAAHLPGSIYQRVMERDGTLRFTYMTPYLPAIMGISVDEVLNDPETLFGQIEADDLPAYRAALEASARAMTPLDIEIRLRDETGEQRWVQVLGQPRAGTAGAVIWDGMAIETTKRKEAEHQLQRLAYHDRLTDALNREGLMAHLHQQLAADGWRACCRVVMLDIQHQHDINETYGFEAGDELLVAIARRLEDHVGPAGVLARSAGDEFAAFLPADTEAAAVAACQELDNAFEQPFDVAGTPLARRARFGYTRLGDEPRPVGELLREAEMALHYTGGDQPGWRPYTTDLDERTRERVHVTDELRCGLARDEFELHFQPKVDLRTGAVVGAEALVRWWHPEHGLRYPGMFIPIAEQSELIGPIGDWILNEACRHLRAWQDNGLPVVQIAVNVSMVQFAEGDFHRSVAAALERHGLEASALTLEITESVFQQDSVLLKRQLDALHAMGVRLALDDFGTGYSSLLYLQQYAFDEIKIDKGFVLSMDGDDYNRRVIASVLGIADTLGATVVAEGVESRAVASELVAMGCYYGQGFYYMRPATNGDFEWLLATRPTLPLEVPSDS